MKGLGVARSVKIDIYNHIYPRAFFDRMVELVPNKEVVKRWTSVPLLYDLEARMRVIDRFEGYSQILTLSLPPIEFLAPPELSPEVARLANDGLAGVCKKHPDYFPAWVAALPMNNIPAALAEIERCIEKLGASGVQVYTSVNGRPLDDPEFFPVFERMAAYDLPVWMHPTRPMTVPDYPSEKVSKYEIWWAFGWPYETAAAMTRMVFSLFFERLPNLKIITHHLGSVIPFFEGRIGMGWEDFGARTPGPEGDAMTERRRAMKRPPLEYFKMFHADTAQHTSTASIRCGHEFFGPDHVLFGTDCPFDPEGGSMWIREIAAAIDRLELSDLDRHKLYAQNALDLLRLQPPRPRAKA